MILQGDVAGGGNNLRPNAFELRFLAGDGDAAGMVEAKLLLRLPEQLPKERMVEVDDRHQVPVRFPTILPHVHRQVTPRHRSRTIQRPCSRVQMELATEPTAPVADFRHRLVVIWALLVA